MSSLSRSSLLAFSSGCYVWSSLSLFLNGDILYISLWIYREYIPREDRGVYVVSLLFITGRYLWRYLSVLCVSDIIRRFK